LAAAWTATLGSLYLSEILKFVPCTLCWYQRILMYPLAIILLVGLLRRDKGVFLYALPFSIMGIGVSTYHYLLQKTDLFTHSAVYNSGIPCPPRGSTSTVLSRFHFWLSPPSSPLPSWACSSGVRRWKLNKPEPALSGGHYDRYAL